MNNENGTIRITPEKGSNPRTLKLTSKVIAMINSLSKNNLYIFNNGLLENFSQNARTQAAEKEGSS